MRLNLCESEFLASVLRARAFILGLFLLGLGLYGVPALQADEHPVTIATASPVVHKGRAYIAAASFEEVRGSYPEKAGEVYAVRITDGEVLWKTSPPKLERLAKAGCNAGQPQAATLIPGIVFAGSLDGRMRAYDTKTGKIIWKYNSKRDYKTVNGVQGNGGSFNGAGVAVVDGWVYFASGYGFNDIAGNVLLAFGPPEGK